MVKSEPPAKAGGETSDTQCAQKLHVCHGRGATLGAQMPLKAQKSPATFKKTFGFTGS